MEVMAANSNLCCETCYAAGMDQNKTALERAFELAKSGEYATVELIRRKVSGEGYPRDQLQGVSLRRQLKELILAARAQ
jgi:hypothetical protein